MQNTIISYILIVIISQNSFISCLFGYFQFYVDLKQIYKIQKYAIKV